MGHEADDVPLPVADTRDIVEGAVRVRAGGARPRSVAVAEYDLVVRRHVVPGLRLGAPVPVPVGDRETQDVTSGQLGGERRPDRLDADEDVLAAEPLARVEEEGAREETRLAEDLEAVADAEDGPALRREVADGIHDRREAGEGAAPEVVAVGKAARKEYQVGAFQVRPRVPDEACLGPDRLLDGVRGVVVAVRAGEDDDRDARPRPGAHTSTSASYSSMTGLQRSFSAICPASAVASAASFASTSTRKTFPARTSPTPGKPRRVSAPAIAFP